jgi:hypothetical protein
VERLRDGLWLQQDAELCRRCRVGARRTETVVSVFVLLEKKCDDVRER